MRHWQEIMIHHSATPDGATFDWQAIRRYHMTDEMHRYADIGYHFGVEKIGDRYETLVGRSLRSPGAHCRGRNYTAIGICVVGNYDIVAPSADALMRCAELCRVLMDMFDIPIQRVVAHRSWNPHKTCPGKMFDMNTLKQYIIKL